jgi:hypothetical protein
MDRQMEDAEYKTFRQFGIHHFRVFIWNILLRISICWFHYIVLNSLQCQKMPVRSR